MPTFKINKEILNIPHKIQLADPNYYTPGDINMLLEVSVFWELLCSKQIKQSRRSPILQETQFGWIVSEVILHNKSQLQGKSYCGISTNSILHKQLEKFWHVEELEQDSTHSQEESQCEEHFISTHARDDDGRFIVKLPLNDKVEKLGESCNIAEKRFRSLERKLNRQPELKQRYHEFMEYLHLHHMQEVPPDKQAPKGSYYVPHHAVIKESSDTTKVRVVFDASCKTSSGTSLNDCLLVGPTIQDNLFDIIIRLQQHKYAMSADVAKMYRQVNIAEEHRDLQRILWRWNKCESIRIFNLNTVTYGMSSSSFLAIRCMQEIARQMQVDYPEASRAIMKDFYVDDLLTGAPTIEALQQLRDISEVLANARFILRKWNSNTPMLQGADNKIENNVTLGETTKVLGLLWNTTDDTFHYGLKIKDLKGNIT